VKHECISHLIADDHEIVRHGIRTLIAEHPGWEGCGEAVDGRDAVEKARALRPDLALLDVGMPNLNGLDAARQILAFAPRTRVLILTMHESEQVVREVLEVGARGFLLKSDAARDLVSAVEALQRRTTFFTSSVAEMVLNGYLNRGIDERKPLKDRYPPRARSRSAAGGGQVQQGGCSGFGSERENRRNAPYQPDAQTRSALGRGPCPLCRSQQHRAGRLSRSVCRAEPLARSCSGAFPLSSTAFTGLVFAHSYSIF